MDNKLALLELKDLLLLNQSGTWGEEGDVNDIPVLRSTNIHHGCLVLDDIAYRKIAKNDLEKYKLENGDILVTKSSGSQELVGKCCRFISSDKRPFGFSNFVQRLRVDSEKVDANYLFFYLVSPYAKAVLKKISNTTSGLRNLRMQDYERQLVPVPSLSVQRKIASILEKAESAKQKRQEAIRLTNELLKTSFLNMFGDPISNPKNWMRKKVTEVCKNERNAIKAGPFGSSLKKEFYVQKGYKIYGQEQVIRDDLSYGNYYISPEKYKELESCKIGARDVLISLVGSYGKISIVPKIFEPGIINPRLVKLSLDQNIVLPIYFKFLLLTSGMKRKIISSSHGGTMGIINLGIIKRIDFIIPPLEIQQKFADLVQKIEALKSKQRESEQELNNLFNSLMQKAFKGELFNN